MSSGMNQQTEPGRPPRARDLEISCPGTPGRWNAVTDVPGVEVGYATLIAGDGPHVTPETAALALDGARSGPLAEGSVGGGTGMNCCGFKGGRAPPPGGWRSAAAVTPSAR